MPQVQDDKAEIEALVRNYIDALAQSKTDAILPLFTRDAVLMAADATTMEGGEQLKGFFEHGRSAIKLEAELEFDEIVVSGDTAFARSHSQVRVTVLQTNETHPETTRELFLLNREDDQWKIGRNMFNRVSNPQ